MINKCSTVIISLLFAAAVLAPQLSPAGEIAAPDTEKRSCIQSVDGYAYLSENMTLAQSRAAAFATAKQQALEMAQTYIRSKTQVDNYVLTFDQVTAESDGSVTVLEQIDHGIKDNNRYHVWIKAEVEYRVGAGPRIDKDFAGAPLTVSVWTSQKTYQKDDHVAIYILGNRDFYARVVNISASGDIIQLLPNAFRKDHFFTGGKTYVIPDKDDRFKLIVSPPFGEDRVVVYAGELPLGDIALEDAGQGLQRFSGTRQDLGLKTRAISVVKTDAPVQGVEFYEASHTFVSTP